MIVPTLAANSTWRATIGALERQTFRDFHVVVVDNSGGDAIRRLLQTGLPVTVIGNARNVGFGAAINQGIRIDRGEYVAVLNDDAEPAARWLAEMVQAMEQHSEAGMCAPRIRLHGTDTLDSAGMLIGGDGSSKQRGQGRPAGDFSTGGETLFPSGCAALYRRRMLEQTGLFDESFFLYCEDTDLGLRGRWQGWRCLYVPDAEVEHHYSISSGKASPMKAYYVERNRLMVLVRNFPARALWMAPWYTLRRYYWHLRAMRAGRGAAGQFAAAGGGGATRLALLLARAHLAVLRALPRLLRERASIRRQARISPSAFMQLFKQHAISPKEIAAL